MINKSQQNGFTLIELLVVISIIGLLSSVVMYSLVKARSKARDAKRKADLATIVKAVEMYSIDYPNNGYVVAGTGWSGCGCGWFNYEESVYYITGVGHGLVNAGYFSRQPLDPSIKTIYEFPQYMIYPCASGFLVYAQLENPSAVDTAAFNAIPTSCTAYQQSIGMNYAIGHY